jgi:PAS domain S-box-containing protein
VNLMPIDNAESRKDAVGSSEEFLISRTKLEGLQRLAAIIETADDAIISKTIEGVVTSWNRGAERIFGYPELEMLGQSIFRLACVDGEKDMIAVLHQICRGERVDHYETMRRRKDGTEIAVSLTVSPMRNSSGEIVGASKIARDISARSRRERLCKSLKSWLPLAVWLPALRMTSITRSRLPPIFFFFWRTKTSLRKENTTSRPPNANCRASPTLRLRLWVSTAAAESRSGFL